MFFASLVQPANNIIPGEAILPAVVLLAVGFLILCVCCLGR